MESQQGTQGLYLCLGTTWSLKCHQVPSCVTNMPTDSLCIKKHRYGTQKWKPHGGQQQFYEQTRPPALPSAKEHIHPHPHPLVLYNTIKKIFSSFPLLQTKYCYQHRQLWNTVGEFKKKKNVTCIQALYSTINEAGLQKKNRIPPLYCFKKQILSRVPEFTRQL